MKYLLLILALSLFGCTASQKIANKAAKIQRLERQIEDLGGKYGTDTVFQTIEVIVPKIEFDTVLRNVNFVDTLVVTRDKVVTRVKINTTTKEVYVKTKCPERKQKVTVTHTVTKTLKTGDSTWVNIKQVIPWALAFLVIGFILGKVIRFSV